MIIHSIERSVYFDAISSYGSITGRYFSVGNFDTSHFIHDFWPHIIRIIGNTQHTNGWENLILEQSTFSMQFIGEIFFFWFFFRCGVGKCRVIIVLSEDFYEKLPIIVRISREISFLFPQIGECTAFVLPFWVVSIEYDITQKAFFVFVA